MAHLPILPSYGESYHPSADWSRSLDRKKQNWTARLPLADDRDAAIHAWTLAAWAAGAEGFEATPPPAADRAREAVEAVQRRADVLPKGDRDALTLDDLLGFARILAGKPVAGDSPVLRSTEAEPQIETRQPASPHTLPALLDMTLDWFTTDSFTELHPVEKAALFHLRMLDLQPFTEHNNRLVRIVASFYTLREGLPPLIFQADDAAIYRDIVGYAFQMITQPSLEIFAFLLGRTLDRWIELAER